LNNTYYQIKKDAKVPLGFECLQLPYTLFVHKFCSYCKFKKKNWLIVIFHCIWL